MPILWNPTDEPLEGMHDGISYILQPGDKKKVTGTTARHLISHLETRGLVSLEYGDEGTVEVNKGKGALVRQKKFELNQIRRYNIDNQKRARGNLQWVEPPKIVEHFAIKHNVKLEEFHSMVDTKGEELAATMKQNAELQQELRDQKDQMKELLNSVNELKIDKIKNDEMAKLDRRTKEYKDKLKEVEVLEGETITEE